MQDPQSPKPTSRDYQILGLKIVGDFGASIAIPVVVFVLIGQYFDKKHNTGPWFTILAFIISACVSAKIIHQKAKRYGTEYKALNDASRINKNISEKNNF